MTLLLRRSDAPGFPSISSSWRRLPGPPTLLPVGWVAFHPWHRCHPGAIAVSLEEIPVSRSFLDLTSSSLLAYSFVSVEYTLQSSLRKDMWDGFLETLHIWKCLILDWLISLGIEFQVGNYFPPETLSVFFFSIAFWLPEWLWREGSCSHFLSFQTGTWENLLSVLRVMTFLDNVPWQESIFIYCAGPSVSPGNLESFSSRLWYFLKVSYWWSLTPSHFSFLSGTIITWKWNS